MNLVDENESLNLGHDIALYVVWDRILHVDTLPLLPIGGIAAGGLSSARSTYTLL